MIQNKEGGELFKKIDRDRDARRRNIGLDLAHGEYHSRISKKRLTTSLEKSKRPTLLSQKGIRSEMKKPFSGRHGELRYQE